jgi:hypothetical protein
LGSGHRAFEWPRIVLKPIEALVRELYFDLAQPDGYWLLAAPSLLTHDLLANILIGAKGYEWN